MSVCLAGPLGVAACVGGVVPPLRPAAAGRQLPGSRRSACYPHGPDQDGMDGGEGPGWCVPGTRSCVCAVQCASIHPPMECRPQMVRG